ncbi:MAG TPA: RidA family protein [Candidatus Polarisedimenticolia bacterium]|nr:RidA family protein [Candidatus Polarisedimenticolia bacterium]
MPPGKEVSSEGAPRAIGPYSQGIVSGDLVFLSGQVPIDPSTGNLVPGGIEAQVARVLENLRAVLEAAGCGLPQVVRTTVYLTDLKDFESMNAVYARYFPETRPARATVQVSALPRGARVEIDAIARRG